MRATASSCLFEVCPLIYKSLVSSSKGQLFVNIPHSISLSIPLDASSDPLLVLSISPATADYNLVTTTSQNSYPQRQYDVFKHQRHRLSDHGKQQVRTDRPFTVLLLIAK